MAKEACARAEPNDIRYLDYERTQNTLSLDRRHADSCPSLYSGGRFFFHHQDGTLKRLAASQRVRPPKCKRRDSIPENVVCAEGYLASRVFQARKGRCSLQHSDVKNIGHGQKVGGCQAHSIPAVWRFFPPPPPILVIIAAIWCGINSKTRQPPNKRPMGPAAVP